MARKTSQRPGASQDAPEDLQDTTAADTPPAEDATPETETPEEAATPEAPETEMAEPTGPGGETAEPAAEETAADTPPEPEPEPEPEPAPRAEAPAPAPERIVEHRGPGFVPLVLGGVIAAGLGYGAAYLGYLPMPGQADGDIAALSESLESQGQAVAALSDRAEAIEAQVAALPTEMPEVDLSPVLSRLDEIEAAVDGAAGDLQAMGERVTALEARPILSGEGGDADAAAMAAAVAQLQSALQDQQDENAAMAAEIRALASEAQASIAAAEERAQARVGSATAQAALSQLRISMAAGTPFAGPLQDVAANAGVDVPEGLLAAAETGIPTLEELQASFPAAARAALPVALRETAGDGTMDRFGAFLRGQVGGRSLEPREGDDPDAILSRAEADLDTGDIAGTLGEIEALPPGAQDAMAGWVAEAQTRLEATEALDAFSAALDGAN